MDFSSLNILQVALAVLVVGQLIQIALLIGLAKGVQAAATRSAEAVLASQGFITLAPGETLVRLSPHSVDVTETASS